MCDIFGWMECGIRVDKECDAWEVDINFMWVENVILREDNGRKGTKD